MTTLGQLVTIPIKKVFGEGGCAEKTDSDKRFPMSLFDGSQVLAMHIIDLWIARGRGLWDFEVGFGYQFHCFRPS